MKHDKGEGFTGRTGNYSRSRPDYPDEIIDHLVKDRVIGTGSLIADIGSGTGKLSRLFLKHGFSVICVEPNPEMREQAKRDLMEFSNVTINDATAENTGLPDHSVDIVVAGQAFHWFDPMAAGKEFLRILKPGGKVALIWNDRVQNSGSFNEDYERICSTYSNGYHKSGSRSLDREVIGGFFGGKEKLYLMENSQKLDLNGVMERYFSASYAIGREDAQFNTLIKEIENAYSRHERNGYVTIEYETRLFLGIPNAYPEDP
jgi:ubiquinone/menaquinone biosynthesis C-methylase UbiE